MDDFVSPVMTAQMASSYERDGFLIVPEALSPAEVEELRADTLSILRGNWGEVGNLPEFGGNETDDELLEQVLCIHQIHKISPIMHRFLAQKTMKDVLTTIIGPNVKCMQSMLFIKPPGFQGQGWHQDEIYIPTRDRSLTGGWIALDDATEENGCLWVLPGSNKGILYELRSHENPDEFDGTGESYGFDPSGEIPVEAKTGDVVFFNGYLLHRSFKNRSSSYRRVLVNHYMNAWSLLPWRLQEGQTAARSDFRDIVMVAGSDPYEWKGTEDVSDIGVRQCKASQELERS